MAVYEVLKALSAALVPSQVTGVLACNFLSTAAWRNQEICPMFLQW